MAQNTNTYKINNTHYALKERYTLKEWGKILNIIKVTGNDDEVNAIALLMSEDKINELLSIILNSPVEGDIYEDDFSEVARAINDFFQRKKNLMKNT